MITFPVQIIRSLLLLLSLLITLSISALAQKRSKSEENAKPVEPVDNVYTPVPKNIQKEAMAHLQKETFITTTWLLGQNILRK